MLQTVRRQPATTRLAILAITAIGAAQISGCASSSPPGSRSSAALPTRNQAFQEGEIYINQILLAIHQKPTTEFTYTEGPCNETDDQHGDLSIGVSIPENSGASQSTDEVTAVETAMKRLGYGTPVFQAEENSVYVDNGSFSILFGADSKNAAVSVQTCYATPAPTTPPGLATEQQRLTVSPAPTTTAGLLQGAPGPGATSSLPTQSTSAPN